MSIQNILRGFGRAVALSLFLRFGGVWEEVKHWTGFGTFGFWNRLRGKIEIWEEEGRDDHPRSANDNGR